MGNKFTFYYVKKLQGNNLLSGGAIAIGATTGAGSSTRIYNYCKQHSKQNEICLNKIINYPNSNPNPNIVINLNRRR
jgi:hypothetical protein